MTSVPAISTSCVWLAAAALLLLAGCALFGDDGEAAAEAGYASYSASCSPVDGFALEIFLTAQKTSCDTLSTIRFGVQQTRSFTHLLLYGTAEPVTQAPHALGREADTGLSYSAGGWGTRCEAFGECVTLERGSVTFMPVSRGEQTVDVTLFFEDGTRESGRYMVQQCERVVLCG